MSTTTLGYLALADLARLAMGTASRMDGLEARALGRAVGYLAGATDSPVLDRVLAECREDVAALTRRLDGLPSSVSDAAYSLTGRADTTPRRSFAVYAWLTFAESDRAEQQFSTCHDCHLPITDDLGEYDDGDGRRYCGERACDDDGRGAGRHFLAYGEEVRAL